MFRSAIIPALITVAFAFGANAIAGSAAPSGTSPSNQTPVTVKAGQTKQFRLAAGKSSTISWQVNGIPGGNNSIGKVTSSGAYTAPATAPDAVIELTVVDSTGDRTLPVARIQVLDDPAILEAHQRWTDGAVAAAATYGCSHPILQQGTTESVTEALKVYLLTADKSSCLILSPISAEPDSTRYSYAWGGNVDGVDIYYISDVGRPRIVLGNPVSGE